VTIASALPLDASQMRQNDAQVEKSSQNTAWADCLLRDEVGAGFIFIDYQVDCDLFE
jgi:hypothetical protein